MIQKIKDTIKLLLPYKLILLNNKRIAYKNRERRVSFGERYPDKTFYVIRGWWIGAGLLANYNTALSHVIHALTHDYIPVIDMKNFKTYYNEEQPVHGTMNAWEYFFKQPVSGYGLEEAYSAKNIVLGEIRHLTEYVPDFYFEEDAIRFYNDIHSKYLQFNEITTNAIDERRNIYFKNRKNILGVKHRGTDYLLMNGHKKVPSIETSIAKTEECFKKWNMEWVYLSCEEEEAVIKFRERFGEKLIVTDSRRISKYRPEMGWTPEIGYNRKNDKYLRNLEYLTDIVLLSECDALIGPIVSGMDFALMLNNNKYTHKYIFDFGRNPYYPYKRKFITNNWNYLSQSVEPFEYKVK